MPSTVKRQSAAVMFTDIAGYTSIMASDEEKALSLLQDKRKILKPLIKQHDGIYVKGTGDGTLSYFDSAYKASKCAKLFQESIYDNDSMNVRVGIHVGDIVLDDGDVYGDGVNVASRLESMSPVGGICVSNTVCDELRNKKEFDGMTKDWNTLILKEFKNLQIPSRLDSLKIEPRVLVDNLSSKSHTIVEINAKDKIGLLYTLASELFLMGLQVSTARISTYGLRVVDVFYLRDMTGSKIIDIDKTNLIKNKLMNCLTSSDLIDSKLEKAQ